MKSQLPGLIFRRRSREVTDPRILAFARGLAMGALVGAAVAGSTIWNRRHHHAGRAGRRNP